MYANSITPALKNSGARGTRTPTVIKPTASQTVAYANSAIAPLSHSIKMSKNKIGASGQIRTGMKLSPTSGFAVHRITILPPMPITQIKKPVSFLTGLLKFYLSYWADRSRCSPSFRQDDNSELRLDKFFIYTFFFVLDFYLNFLLYYTYFLNMSNKKIFFLYCLI